jgi:hypothetical protein
MKQKYTVKGVCLVPCEVEMDVEATSEAEAVSIALSSRWQDKIYSGYDDSAAFDWLPTAELAQPPKPRLRSSALEKITHFECESNFTKVITKY